MGEAASCLREPSCSIVEAPCTRIAPPCTAGLSLDLSNDNGMLDAYEIGDILGSGAFGQVRACWPIGEDDDHAYAVKIIDTRHASPLISPKQEAEILQSVSHPHLVELVDVFEQQDWLFVVEERIEGGELFDAIANRTSEVTESCIAVIGQQLLQALQHLHERSIVHRDVKAENVLLSTRPSVSGEWHVKIIDFGLAMRLEQFALLRACNGNSSTQDLICGTLHYCAPEIWVGKYGPGVDIWALGVMLYLALFGTFPFCDADPDVVEYMICMEGLNPPWQPVSNNSLNYRVSQSAIECLGTFLDKDPAERCGADDALQDPWFLNIDIANSLADTELKASLHVDQPIPLDVRLKAGLAASHPPVSEATEQSRTAALGAMTNQRRKPRAPSTISNSSRALSDDTTPDVAPIKAEFAAPTARTLRDLNRPKEYSWVPRDPNSYSLHWRDLAV